MNDPAFFVRFVLTCIAFEKGLATTVLPWQGIKGWPGHEFGRSPGAIARFTDTQACIFFACHELVD